MTDGNDSIRFSLKTKTTILIIVIVLVLGGLSLWISDQGLSGVIRRQYEKEAMNLANTAAVTVDVPRLERLKAAAREIYLASENKVTSEEWGTPAFEEYMARYAGILKSEDFRLLREELRRIQDVNDVDCLYVSMVEPENEQLVYLCDAAYEDACDPGVIDPLFEINREVLTNPKRGFPPYITDMEAYGRLMSAGAPIYNAEGTVVAYAFADISMKEILQQKQNNMWIVVAAMAAMAVIICAVSIIVVERAIIRPLKQLKDASERYFMVDGDLDTSFSEVQIHTGDELEMLAGSMARLEQSVNDHITRLMKTTNDLNTAKNLANEMDRQANVDELTKVRNKRAFSVTMEQINERLKAGEFPFGFVMGDMNNLKEINDEFGHDKGDLVLQATCSLICSTFKHSPVFRIGGDEFVVVLEDEDYRNRETLLRDIREEAERRQKSRNLPPWLQVSIALGLAEHDPKQDQNAEDTLRRADEIMYAEKRQFKEAQKAAGVSDGRS